jgi:hypothetical protein
MAITVTNQQPTVLHSTYNGSLAGKFEPCDIIKQEIVKPLLSPLVQSAPVVIDDNGKVLSDNDITNLLMSCSQTVTIPDAEKKMKEIFSKTLAYYDPALSVSEVYAVQAGKKSNMIMPSDRVLYTPTDVIDVAKALLSGTATPEEWFATVAFYARTNTFGYFFANDDAWSDFKTWFATEINSISNLLTSETQQLCADIQQIRLNYLTQSFVVRDDDSQNNDPYSFARVFPTYLMLYEKYIKTNRLPAYTAGHMPFSFAENICPRTIVIMNVEKHAHAHPAEIKKEWDIIKAAMTMKPKVMGLNKIASLTAVSRMAQKMQAISNSIPQGPSNGSMRSATIKFRKTAPTSIDLYGYIMRIYKHASYVQTSENSVKSGAMTYQRPSRRDPDNPDRPGKTTKYKYKPDLHIYLDCSGSISERNYQDAMKTCIKLAKKMNVNIFFNSFSDYMSVTTKLHVKDRTLKDIYEEFKNIPKVSGGTDYEQIWHYINKSDKRSREVSIIISDFEYWAPNHYVKHPRFLYYAPISAYSWDTISYYAKKFAESMLSICPDIRKHILM